METTPVGKPLLESVIRQLTYWNISVVTHAAPALKTAVSSQSKSAGMEKASLLNLTKDPWWTEIVFSMQIRSFPSLLLYCSGSAQACTRTLKFWGNVVGVTKVKFRDKLWRCRKGNTGKWYICSVAAQTCTLTQLPCVSEFSPFGSWEVQSVCRWRVGTDLRIASKVLGEIDNWNWIAAVDTSLPTNISSLVIWLPITVLKGWPVLYVIHQQHASFKS